MATVNAARLRADAERTQAVRATARRLAFFFAGGLRPKSVV